MESFLFVLVCLVFHKVDTNLFAGFLEGVNHLFKIRGEFQCLGIFLQHLRDIELSFHGQGAWDRFRVMKLVGALEL